MNYLSFLLVPISFILILIIILFIYVWLSGNLLVSILGSMVYIILLLSFYCFLEELRQFIVDTGMQYISIFNYIFYFATVLNIVIGSMLTILVIYQLILNP
ncbi:MAG: hypothetical protein ACFFCV_11710 [Promethearchaeota archaeon]